MTSPDKSSPGGGTLLPHITGGNEGEVEGVFRGGSGGEGRGRRADGEEGLALLDVIQKLPTALLLQGEALTLYASDAHTGAGGSLGGE